MQSGPQQQVTFGNQQAPDYPQAQNGINSTTKKLWGAKPRMIASMGQILTGLIEVVLGIVVVALPSINKDWDRLDYDKLDVGCWGIWCGAFGILTGCFGLGSQRKKSIHMVTAYMALSIITAVMCVACIIPEAISIVRVKNAQRYFYQQQGLRKHTFWYSGEVEFNESRAKAHLILYILLLVPFSIQGILSIIGAGSTCRTVCCQKTSTDQTVVCYHPTQAPVTASGPAPPFVTAPPSQPNLYSASVPKYPVHY